MAKDRYKIPYDLDQSYGDIKVPIKTNSGVSTKPLSVRSILGFLASATILFYVVSHTMVSSGSAFQIITFCILWLLTTVILLKTDSTNRMGAQLLPALIDYVPKSNRHVLTRRKNNASPFYSIAGIREIKENGMIIYNDGTYGYWFRIVGSASILLFESDQNAIIQRVDNFYCKWKQSPSVEIGFVTSKEPQKVYRQIAHLQKLYNNLDYDDPDLLNCAEEQFKVLNEYVGGSFKSIHQYMYVKANSVEELRAARQIIQSEAENSDLVFKQISDLYEDDLLEVLKSVYGSVKP